MKAFTTFPWAIILATLAITACSSAPSGRDPAAEAAMTDMTKGPDAGVPAIPPAKKDESDCRPFKNGDIKAGTQFELTGTLELNPIAAEALRGNENLKKERPAQYKEIQNVLYVLVPDKAPYVGFFSRSETQACRPKKFTLSLEAVKEFEKANEAYAKKTKVTVRGRATWPESSVELINNGMVGAASLR